MIYPAAWPSPAPLALALALGNASCPGARGPPCSDGALPDAGVEMIVTSVNAPAATWTGTGRATGTGAPVRLLDRIS
jgi:hypothetical protein